MKKTRFPILLFLALSSQVRAQEQIPFVRQSFLDKVDIAQKRIERILIQSNNESQSSSGDAVVDSVQTLINGDKVMDENSKLGYLRGLSELLGSYEVSLKSRSISPFAYTNLARSFAQAMSLNAADKSILPVIDGVGYKVGQLIVDNYSFKNNRGVAEAKQVLITKDLLARPGDEMSLLDRHPEYLATDSVIKQVAKRDPDVIYTYARANSTLSQKVKSSNDLLVSTIVKLAPRQNGRQYFPFLDNLYRGKITLDEIDNKSSDVVSYYKLLVATEIEYAKRVLQRDTPMAMDALFSKLKLTARDGFINEINGLHENPDRAVRFACLKPLNAQELYYVAISGELELYTSSYLFGVYPEIFNRGGKDFSGDDLLTSVYFDHFKKWIKMAANYNTLDDFLGKMKGDHGSLLMAQFASNLDKNKGKDSLEDAVDVAGSYGSIKKASVRKLVLDEVQRNLEEGKAENDTKKATIYNILNVLFESSESKKIDVSQELGIEPVYFMPISKLKNENGAIIIQQFFYGDKDGQTNWDNFFGKYGNAAGWKTTYGDEWAVTKSTSGTPITIYSNRPLDENKGLDDKAQQDLNAYLDENDLHPTVVFHRGHSFYLNTTIKQLPPTSKVVMLGSCGAFQNLNDVLKVSPEAQIISSRQTGTGLVNLTVIAGILDYLKTGKDLDWIQMWKHFGVELKGNAEFPDYVPPYDNLGAVFLMAYKKEQEKHEEM